MLHYTVLYYPIIYYIMIYYTILCYTILHYILHYTNNFTLQSPWASATDPPKRAPKRGIPILKPLESHLLSL